MKNILYLMFILTLLLFNGIAYSSTVKNTKIAFIDRDKIIDEASVIKHIKDQIDNKSIQFQQQFSTKEEELRKSEEELTKQKDLLSPEAFERKANDFNKLVMETQRSVSLKRSQLENLYMNSIDMVYEKIKDISNNLAKENNIDLILFVMKKSQVFYYNSDIDISDKVLSILNKEMPKLDIKKDVQN